MAILIKRNQIDGLIELYDTVMDSESGIKNIYPANQVKLSVAEDTVNHRDAIDTDAQTLLTELKYNVDDMLGGSGSSVSLPELARRIQKLNSELNGGDYYDALGSVSASHHNGLKNQYIKDVVRVEFTYQNTGGSANPSKGATVSDNSSIPTNLISEDINIQDADDYTYNTTKLPAYTTEGEPIVSNNGQPIYFNLVTQQFSDVPYVIDYDATMDSFGSKRDGTGADGSEVTPDPMSMTYKILGTTTNASGTTTYEQASFKVFPRGKWTLENLPASALLDNAELQLIAYDQALNKIIVQLARDTNLVNRIVEAVGDDAINDAVLQHTDRIDNRLDLLEGASIETDLSVSNQTRINKAAVRYEYVYTAPTMTAAQYSPSGVYSVSTIRGTAENATLNTTVPSKNYVDDRFTSIEQYRVGSMTDPAAINADGYVTLGTAFAQINGIKDKMVYKNHLVQTIRDSAAESVQASSESVISEEALVGQFVSINTKHDSLDNKLEHFMTDHESVDGSGTYTIASANNRFLKYTDDVIHEFTKVERGGGSVYNYAASGYNHLRPDVPSIKLFNEKISELIDTEQDHDDASYKWEHIVISEGRNTTETPELSFKGAGASVSERGYLFKEREAALSQSTAVASEKFARLLVDEEKDRASYNELKIYQEAYLWDNIVNETLQSHGVTVDADIFSHTTSIAAGSYSFASVAAEHNIYTYSSASSLATDIVPAEDTSSFSTTIGSFSGFPLPDEKTQTIKIPSATWTKYRIEEAKALASLRTAKVREELLQRVLYEHNYAEQRLAFEVKFLNEVIAALDEKTYDWRNIQMFEGLGASVTVYSGGQSAANVVELIGTISAETNLSETIPVVSQTYTNQHIAIAKAEAQQYAHGLADDLDQRIDVLEAITPITERLKVTVTPNASDATKPPTETITLSHEPYDLNEVIVIVNGVNYYALEENFTITSNVITWHYDESDVNDFYLSQVLDAQHRYVMVTYRYINRNKITRYTFNSAPLSTDTIALNQNARRSGDVARG